MSYLKFNMNCCVAYNKMKASLPEVHPSFNCDIEIELKLFFSMLVGNDNLILPFFI